MDNVQPKRTRFVHVRFTPQEYAQLETLAGAAQVELSAYVRSVLLGASVPRRARKKSASVVVLGETLVALNRIGSNINQLARQANATGNVEAYRQASADRAVLAAAAKAVLDALESAR